VRYADCDGSARVKDARSQGALRGWSRPSRLVRYGGPVSLFVAVGLYVEEFFRWPAFVTQIDLMVYRFGGQRVLQGLDLYSTGIFGSNRVLLFTYTPFAALCFTPLSMLSLPWLRALSLAAAAALLTYSVQRMLTACGLPRRQGWWTLTPLLVGLCLWSEPVRYSLQLGQINLVILAVVVADLLGPPGRRWAGIGIGLMAGIKLTPAIFLIYLALIGHRRAALVGAGAFLGTVALGFTILRGDSATYWLGGKFDKPQRVSPDPAVSSSVRGLFLRLHYPAAIATAVAVTLAVFCVAVAVLAWRRGHPVLGLSLIGLAGAAASPFSWSHHWVWLVALIVHLAYRGFVLRPYGVTTRGLE
jgi:alpha-1,2-mannosyltransferase